MIKVMHLDMFYFEYTPVFSDNEKVIFENSKIKVSYKNMRKALSEVDVSNIKYDTLFSQRVGQNWTNEEIISSLKTIDSIDKAARDKYKLCFIEPEDQVSISFNTMVETLTKLNYDGQSFSYIAYVD